MGGSSTSSRVLEVNECRWDTVPYTIAKLGFAHAVEEELHVPRRASKCAPCIVPSNRHSTTTAIDIGIAAAAAAAAVLVG